jgi:hypothetical protein
MGSVQQRANRSGIGVATSSFLASLCIVLIAGCSTPQERAARRQAEVEQMMVEYGPACMRLGYTANTDAWRACVLQLNARGDLQRYQSSPGYYGGWGPGYWNGGGWWRPIW